MDTDWAQGLAEGLVGNGCQYLSIALEEKGNEIREVVNRAAAKFNFPLHAEEAISEKIGYEIALTYSYGKKRSAFLTHGFSLPVAMDPLMSSIYTGVAGGFVVVALDATPSLPYGSKSDPVSLAMFAKMPVVELSSFEELGKGLERAFSLSEKYETPIMLHLDTKIAGGKVSGGGRPGRKRKADFEKNPARWAATPRFRFILHKKLNQRLKEIAESGTEENVTYSGGEGKDWGIVCNQANRLLIERWAERHNIPVLAVSVPFPLPVAPVRDFVKSVKHAIMVEDRFPTMQFQLPEKRKIEGRLTDERFCRVYSWTEDALLSLLNEVILGKEGSEVNDSALREEGQRKTPLRLFLESMKRKNRSLLVVADKTPLTMDLPADHFVSRGGAISFAAGYAHALGGEASKKIVGITDSAALLHYGMQAVTNAVYNTIPVRCLLLVKPEDEEAVKRFLNAMKNVAVVPLNPSARDAERRFLEPFSQPVTFYWTSVEEKV